MRAPRSVSNRLGAGRQHPGHPSTLLRRLGLAILLTSAVTARAASAQAEINFSVADNTVFTDSIAAITVEMCTAYTLRDTTATLRNSAGTSGLFLSDGPAAVCTGENTYAFLLDLTLQPGANWVIIELVDWNWATYADSVRLLYQPARAKVTAPGTGGVRIPPNATQALAFVVTNVSSVAYDGTGVVRCAGPFTSCNLAGGGSTFAISLDPGEALTVETVVTATGVPGSGNIRVVVDGTAPDSALTPLQTTNSAIAKPTIRAALDTIRQAPATPANPVSFTVSNPDPAVSRTVSFIVNCHVALTCSSPAPLTLRPLSDTVVVINVSTSDDPLGSVRTMVVSALATSPADTARDTSVVLLSRNSTPSLDVQFEMERLGPSTAREQCLSFAAGPSAAVECGHLRIAYDFPGVRTMGKVRAPRLIYLSQLARPQLIVPVELRRSASNETGPFYTTLTLSARPHAPPLNTVVQDTIPWTAACATDAGCRVNLALDLYARDIPTGAYELTLAVQWGSVNHPPDTTTVVVVNDAASPYGAGWWLEGVERLFAADTLGNSYVWVGGDGSTRLYLRQNDTLFTAAAPLVTRNDPLVQDSSGFERRVTKAALVRFDVSGRHLYTQNAEQHRTLLHYSASDATKLDSISLPRHTGGTGLRAFQFEWVGADSSRRLSGVKTLSLASDSWRSASIQVDAESRRLAWIRDAADDTVFYSYDSTAATLLTAQRNRSGAVTTYQFDPLRNVVGFGMTVSGDSLFTSICPVESRSRVACAIDGSGLAPLTPGRWHTVVDGPRPDTDVRDLTRFFVGRFGAVDSIVDALGGRTRLWREHPTLRGVVTKLRDVAGLETTADYDSRGLLLSSAVKAPYGDTTQTATTSFAWDTTWHALKEVTGPTGIVMKFGVQPSDGLRIWEQLGADSATRVHFSYTDTRLLAGVTLPGGILIDSLSRNTLGNVALHLRPMGLRVSTAYNADGSVQEVQTLDGGDSLTTQRLAYDALGRVVRDTTRSFAMAYVIQPEAVEPLADTTRALTAVVTTAYDKEGRPLPVHRITATSGFGAAAATSTWAYDEAGRTIRSSDGLGTDTTFYDRGGNPVRIISRRGHEIRQTFDALGRVTTRTSPQVTYPYSYCLDCHGDEGSIPADTVRVPEYWTAITSDFFVRDIVVPTETSVFGYDDAGRLVQADNPMVRIRRSYYPNGLLRADTSTIRRYDLEAVTPFDGTHRYSLQYSYNLDGKVTSRRDGFGGHQVFGYNVLGHLATTSDSALTTDTSRVATATFSYDDLHRLSSQSVAGVSDVWTYDAEGRPIVRAGTMIDSMDYDARGKRTRVSGRPLHDGHTEIFSAAYDGFGHLVASGFTGGANNVSDEFLVDAFGNNLWRHRNRTTTLNELEVLEEAIFSGEKLTSSTGVPRPDARSGPNGCGPAVRAYSDLGITYDNAGNVRTQQSIRRVWAPVNCEDTFARASGGHQWTWNFYDANEKLRRVQQYHVVDDTVGGVVLTHDYWYDALGRRVLAHTFADTSGGCGNPPSTSPWPEICQQSLTRSAWDGDFLLWESRRPAAWNAAPASLDVGVAEDAWYGQRRNMQAGAIDVPLVVWSGSGVGLAIIRNWRGNAAGAQQFSGSTLAYEPVWPAAQVDVRHAPDARTNPQPGNSWWGSLVSDQADATGLLYRRNRYYDPETGRFTQPDPIGLAGGLNLYGYADGDPINKSDPFGLTPCLAGPVAMRVCAAVATAAGGAIGAALAQDADNLSSGRSLGEGVGTAALEGARDGAAMALGAEFMGTAAGAASRGAAAPSSPRINPRDVAGKSPGEIDAFARSRGLSPVGPNPAAGRGAYLDPVTGCQRILCHPNATPPHAHVNNAAGQRLGIDGSVVPATSPAAHLPIRVP